ncbi:hypothetical protein [Paenibacillus abyssi]|uniref:Uncharacterized protein n=1 Tax=Paenibacillus abyssi TaxID=1340531 RepID=A0A917CQN4_9BACL|nr:hypothetical protein [Paenibacillus abyssi]GGF96301.1 hypothetical protein GCM10010916_11920 [Paenibacillus abyssi]
MKVRLNETNLATFFVVYTCCEVKQLVKEEQLLELHRIKCFICDRQAMYRSVNGDWYTAEGEALF